MSFALRVTAAMPRQIYALLTRHAPILRAFSHQREACPPPAAAAAACCAAAIERKCRRPPSSIGLRERRQSPPHCQAKSRPQRPPFTFVSPEDGE